MLFGICRPVHAHALAVGDDGQLDLPENRGDLTELGKSSPAGDRPNLAHKPVVVVRKTDWDDVWLEGDGFREPEVVSVK